MLPWLYVRNIDIDGRFDIANKPHMAAIEHEAAMANASNIGHVMASKQDRSALVTGTFHCTDGFGLELEISDGEHLVHNKYIRIKLRSHGECQAHIHAARVA